MHRLTLAAVLAAAAPAPAAGQWRLGLETGIEWFSGTSRTTDPPGGAFRPYRPTWWGLRVESAGAARRFAFTLSYAHPLLALEGPGLTVVQGPAIIDVLALQPALVLRLARPSDGVTLRGEAGPLFELWSYDGGDRAHARAGGTAGLSLELGLWGRLTATVAGYLTYTPVSPFAAADVPEDVELEGAWRRSLRGGVRVGL